MEGDKTTMIDTESIIEGKLTGKDARIQGVFQGEIELSGKLYLGEGAKVEAKVTAAVAEIAGEFKGELTVQSLVLLEKARVNGSVDAQTMSVREGAVVNGTVNAGARSKQAPATPPVFKPSQPGPTGPTTG
jgi:cytoskeletal protein CcmA (bactofilin family)